MIATFKLINSYFWKTFYGPILSFVLPILLLGILGNVMRIEYVYPGIIALNMFFLGIIALPLAIMELKGSSLFKYIGSSPVNPLKFAIIIILYYTFISIVSGFIIFISVMVFFFDKVFPNDGFSKGIFGGLTTFIGFISFYISCFIHLTLVIATGLCIATFAKTPQQALTFSIILTIPTMFLSGMVLSVDIIAHSDAMQWISRFIPYRYSTGNIVISTTPPTQLGDIFSHLTISEKQIIFGKESIDTKNGYIDISQTKNNDYNKKFLTSSNDIKDFFQYEKDKTLEDEKTLFRNIFGEATDYFLFKNILFSPESLNNSDNNIFLFNKSWSVRKIPSIESIRKFIEAYFRDYQKGKQINLDAKKYIQIIEKIQSGNFDFLNMWLKSTIQLYSVPERYLNLLIPIFSIGISSWYINDKFSWTNR